MCILQISVERVAFVSSAYDANAQATKEAFGGQREIKGAIFDNAPNWMRRPHKAITRLVREYQLRFSEFDTAVFDQVPHLVRYVGRFASTRKPDFPEHWRTPNFEPERGAAIQWKLVRGLRLVGQ